MYTATSFLVTSARMLYQNTPHQLRRYRKEVSAILPVDTIVTGQPQVGFVHQRRRLQTVSLPLTFHISPREAVQFRVNHGRELFEGLPVPFPPRLKQPADLSSFGRTLFVSLERHRIWKL